MACMNRAMRWMSGSGKVCGSYFFILPIVLSAVGCGSRMAEISGKITYKGKPLTVPGGLVTFAHPTKGNFTGNITSEGGYTISKVPAGEFKIAVVSVVRRGKGANTMQQKRQALMKSGQLEMSPEEREEKISPAPAGPTPAIPPTYSDPEKSGLKYTVTEGRQTHDIDLN